MLASAPPGEAASSMKPTASIGGSSNTWVIAKATATSRIVCTSRPTITARGNCMTRAKSAGVSARPSPNMITPTAAGSRTVVMSVGSKHFSLSGRGLMRVAHETRASVTSANASWSRATWASVVAGHTSIML